MKQAVNKTTTVLSNLSRIKAHSHFRSFLCANNYQHNIFLLEWTTSLKQAGYDRPKQNMKCTKTTDKKFSLCFFFKLAYSASWFFVLRYQSFYKTLWSRNWLNLNWVKNVDFCICSYSSGREIGNRPYKVEIHWICNCFYRKPQHLNPVTVYLTYTHLGWAQMSWNLDLLGWRTAS